MNKLIVKIKYCSFLKAKSRLKRKKFVIKFNNNDKINKDLLMYNLQASFDKNMVLNASLTFMGNEKPEKNFFLAKNSVIVFNPSIYDMTLMYTFLLK